MRKPTPTLRRQILSNQLWETVAFAAKAAFLLLLTPLMLRVWGKEGYGAFALASSSVVFVSMFDLGLRGQTRVELSKAVSQGETVEARHIMARAIGQFGIVSCCILLVAGILSLTGFWSYVLRLPPGQEYLIFTTILFTEIYMFTAFFLEPLIAEGRIGLAKLTIAIGACAAIPAVGFVLYYGGTVTQAVAVWLGCLALGNLLLPWLTGHLQIVSQWEWQNAWKKRSAYTLFGGIWFNLCNVAWLAKNHGLTFLVAAISGPISAGSFFIILRLSEIVGSFGAISSDVMLSGLSTSDSKQRRKVFLVTGASSFAMCLILAAGIGLLTPVFWQFWLKTPAPLGAMTGWLAASLGLASGFNLIVVYAAMGLHKSKMASAWSMAATLFTLVAGVFVEKKWGYPATILVASFSVLLLFPVAKAIFHILQQNTENK